MKGLFQCPPRASPWVIWERTNALKGQKLYFGAKYLEKEALRLKNTYLLAKKAKYYERMTRF